MKPIKRNLFNALAVSLIVILLSCAGKGKSYCLTGAFLGGRPTREDIVGFRNKYGKKPLLVMVFVDWTRFIDEIVIKDVYSQNCTLFVSWEPWQAVTKKGIDYDGLLSGEYDEYILNFAKHLNATEKEVFIRFAHEMNGNWYPWSGTKIGRDKYISIYRYIRDIFDRIHTTNVKWVFCVNWEDVPKEKNHFMLYYPGDEYVDYVGIDGYNWGDTESWSRWMNFKDIFERRYKEITTYLKRPVMITEFSSASSGGNKSIWIKEAMNDIKRMKNIEAFILFNVDKETDWSFPADEDSGRELKKQLENDYFKDRDLTPP